MSLADNIAARTAAETAMEFVREVEQEFRCTIGRGLSGRFWQELAKLVAEHLVQPSETEECRSAGKMTEAVARRFGHEIMPFGEYQGVAVDQVPLERLEWYGDQSFTDDLRRYLQSDRVTRETGGHNGGT